VHDMLLCGFDPYSVTKVVLEEAFKNWMSYSTAGPEDLIKMAKRPWNPRTHAYLYGTAFKSCNASLFLVKVICAYYETMGGNRLIDVRALFI